MFLSNSTTSYLHVGTLWFINLVFPARQEVYLGWNPSAHSFRMFPDFRQNPHFWSFFLHVSIPVLMICHLPWDFAATGPHSFPIPEQICRGAFEAGAAYPTGNYPINWYLHVKYVSIHLCSVGFQYAHFLLIPSSTFFVVKLIRTARPFPTSSPISICSTSNLSDSGCFSQLGVETVLGIYVCFVIMCKWKIHRKSCSCYPQI